MNLPELTDAAQVQSLIADTHYAGPFARAYIALCIAVFSGDPTTIQHAIEAVPGVANGEWKCSWGPSFDPDGSNLAAIATLCLKATNTPLLNVVVVRATDPADGTWLGDIEQIIEDLGVLKQMPLPWLDDSHPARIAAGTSLGLEVVMNLRDRSGVSITDYLRGTQTGPVQDRPAIMVTGHSLGGCLTSVVAPRLVDALKDVSPPPFTGAVSFAGPSAGNADFATYVGTTLDIFVRYYNTLDVIPNWWDQLDATNTIYRPNLETPIGLIITDELFAAIDPKYEQPSPGQMLSGAFANALSWKEEAELQHHASTYLSLLGVAYPIKDGEPGQGQC